jgi:hypothetical protein
MRTLLALALVSSVAACSTKPGSSSQSLGTLTDGTDGGPGGVDGFGGPDGGFGDTGIGTVSPYPGDLGCQDENGNPIPCGPMDIDAGTITDPCYDSQGNFICFGGVMPDGGYSMLQEGPPKEQPKVPAAPVPAPAPKWFCTLDSHPTMTGWWYYWGKVTGGIKGVVGANVLTYVLGSQLTQLSCTEDTKGNCNISGTGFSNKSSCTPLPLGGYNCKCDNDFQSGETQPKGKAIAETQCTYESNATGKAAVTVGVKNAATANISLTWTTTGGVLANGGSQGDSCSWKKVAAANAPPAPPAK